LPRGVGALERLTRLSCIAALGAAVLFCGCGKKNPAAVVGKEPVTNVVEVDGMREALKAWTAARERADCLVLIDPSEEMAAFPEQIRTEVTNAAGHLRRGNAKVLDLISPWLQTGGSVNLGYLAGMYRRVYWVIPSMLPVSDKPVEAYLGYLSTRRAIPRSELVGFEKKGLFITGSICGIPVTITRLADLSLDEGSSAIVHIGIAYFPAMKGEDPAYRTGTASLVAFLKELRDRNIRASMVTVDLASRSGIVGLDLRFFGDVIKEALQTPTTLRDPVPDKWRTMAAAEDSLVAKRYAGAAALYGELAKAYPQDAGLQFSLAIAEGLAGKGAAASTAIVSAYRLDPEYLRGFSQLANVLAASGQVATGLEILNSPALASIYSKDDIDYFKGVFYYTAKRPKDAIGYLAAAAARRPKDFNLVMMYLRTQMEIGDVTSQIYAFQALIDLDERRVAREAPWVFYEYGKVAESVNYLGSANENYEKYVAAVPPDDSLSIALSKKMAEWKAKHLIKPRPPMRDISKG